jgi:hypothetical protein
MIWTMHHIVIDGWGNTILFKTFIEYYKMLESGVPFNDIVNKINKENSEQSTYSDYIRCLNNQDKEKALNYWESQLSGYDSNCRIIPTRVAEKTSDHVRMKGLKIGKESSNKIRKLSEKNNITINSITETVVGIMLQAYSGTNDVVFGKVVAGRNADIPGVENILGLFINTIPVRVTSENDMSAIDLIMRMNTQGTESTGYGFCSLADIQSMTPQGSELNNVLYVFENYSSGTGENDSEDDFINSVDYREQTNYDITINVHDIED